VAETRSCLMISDKMYRLRTLPSEVPAYIALALSSQHVQAAIGRTLSGMAESQTNISQSIVKELEIFRPSPEEQITIVARVAAIDQKLVDEQLAFKKLVQLKTGLMDDLLTGRVRVIPLLDEEEAAHG
ncbi:MAG: hypothetical protein Q7T25_08470, partial [Sideroxyarcus sp.]|nr:hypothetical protein [Sideroxyarcus sp.]